MFAPINDIDMTAFPKAFAENMNNLLGEERGRKLLDALGTEQPTSIRLNTLKSAEGSCDTERVAWCAEGRYLNSRPQFTFDPLFHAGSYYVQEASSMFLGHALRHIAPDVSVALDLCAAPGGKSTHLRSILPDDSILIANEFIRSRSWVLAENMTKWGHPGTMVTNNAPADFGKMADTFDLIVADVPCSGEGMFRKDAEAVACWSEENVATCWQRQREIVSDVWPSLKGGGIMVYSTCTFNRLEDEDNVDWICQNLGAEPVDIGDFRQWGIEGDTTGRGLPVCHFFPSMVKGEGFFLAVIRKGGENSEQESGSKPVKRQQAKKAKEGTKPCKAEKMAIAQIGGWLKRAEDYDIIAEGGTFTALKKSHKPLFDTMKANGMNILVAGVGMAEMKGHDIVPLHSLAMSVEMDRSKFDTCDIDYRQAIAYLRKEAITLPQSAKKGYVLLTYHGVPLGFVKNIGSRANNLYPTEWRIRSGYTPDEPVVIG